MKRNITWSILLLIAGMAGCNEQPSAPPATEAAVSPDPTATTEGSPTAEEPATDIDSARSSAWEPDETNE
jgi:hypothetical protein